LWLRLCLFTNSWAGKRIKTRFCILPFLLCTSVNIAIPTIAAIFGADAITFYWVMNGFLLAAAILSVPLVDSVISMAKKRYSLME
jgi:hypothetical protein